MSGSARSRRDLLLGGVAAGAGVVAAVAALARTAQPGGSGPPPVGRPVDASPAAAPSAVPGTPDHLFAGDSPWNRPIPEGAAVDPASDGIVAAVLANEALVVNVAVWAFGIPFYTATRSTRRTSLGGRAGIGRPIPLAPTWRPNPGADHKLNVIAPETGEVYELQGYAPATGSAYWLVVRDYVHGLGDGAPSGGRSGPTGSGLSQAGGVIRAAEIRRGRIDHALSFVTSDPVADRYRYPATSTDGTARGRPGLEEGMRV